MIDVAGIAIKDSGNIEIETKAGLRRIKRVITVVDNSRDRHLGSDETYAMDICLWGESLEDLKPEKGKIICIKNVRISEYKGATQTVASESSCVYYHDVCMKNIETARIIKWYRGHSDSIKEIKNISQRSEIDNTSNIKSDIILPMTQYVNKGTFIGYVNIENIRTDDRSFYPACKFCNKKLTLELNQLFRCATCNKEFEEADYKYILRIRVSD